MHKKYYICKEEKIMLLKLIAAILAIASTIASSATAEKALATVTNVNNGIVTIVYNGNYYEFYVRLL